MINTIKTRIKRNNIVFCVAVIASVFFFIGALLFLYGTRNINEEKLLQYLQDSISQRKSALNQQIEGDLQVLRGVAIGLSEIDLSNSEQTILLLDKVNRSNSFVRMGLAGTDGFIDLVDLDGTFYHGINFSEMDFFQSALVGDAGVSGTISSPVTGLEVNYYAVPVYQGDKIVGVLCAANMNDILWDILNVPVFQGQGIFMITDSEGSIVAPSMDHIEGITDKSNITQSMVFNPSEKASFLETLSTNGSGTYMAKMSGKDVIITSMTLKHNGWNVLSVVARAGVTDYYNQTATGASVIILIACLFFLFLLGWQRHTMTRNQESLETLAYTDILTGINNQIKFLLDAEILLVNRGNSKYAVWSLDVNKFNNVNDVFGYANGDRLIKGIASILRENLPTDNTAFCRISADLFAGLLAYQEQKEVQNWALALWDQLDRQDFVPTSRMRLSTAIGFYFLEDFPEEKIDVSNMVSRASLARNQAKKSAKNEICFFTNEMRERVRWESELESEGWHALEHGEFSFFLQPKVNIQNGYMISGVEALARWNHPIHGLISPKEFIPLFERNGFVVELDRYIFKQACKWYALECKNEVPEFQLAVNVSRQGLQRKDFLEYYTSVKQCYGISDGVLELEITENAVLDDYVLFQNFIDYLHEKGFVCAIDDFGSGYSSLNMLKNLSIDVLKLDAVFLRDSKDIVREQAVISNCIHMARQLSIKTVSEGVESSQQLEFLQRTGCDIVQGYYFSKPIPPPDFKKLIIETEGHLDLLLRP